MAARTAAPAPLPWQDSSSPSGPDLGEGEGVLQAVGDGPSPLCQVRAMATVQGTPTRKGNYSNSSTEPMGAPKLEQPVTTKAQGSPKKLPERATNA